MAEIVRVARRYILCGEYFAEQRTEVPYRGQQGALVKRDFGALYLDLFPELKLLEQSLLSRDQGWDNVTCWVFEKQA
jgi:spore coat polysaccharide biosynthesis protein SpsF